MARNTSFQGQMYTVQDLALPPSRASDYVVTRFEVSDLGCKLQVIREYQRPGSSVSYHEQWLVGQKGAAKCYHSAIHY